MSPGPRIYFFGAAGLRGARPDAARISRQVLELIKRRFEPAAHFAELATPVRAKRPPWIGVLATPSEAASAADAGRPLHPLILTSFRFVAR